jgi:hypothetical protein
VSFSVGTAQQFARALREAPKLTAIRVQGLSLLPFVDDRELRSDLVMMSPDVTVTAMLDEHGRVVVGSIVDGEVGEECTVHVLGFIPFERLERGGVVQ